MSAIGGKADIRHQQVSPLDQETLPLHDLYELYAFQPRVSEFSEIV